MDSAIFLVISKPLLCYNRAAAKKLHSSSNSKLCKKLLPIKSKNLPCAASCQATVADCHSNDRLEAEIVLLQKNKHSGLGLGFMEQNFKIFFLKPAEIDQNLYFSLLEFSFFVSKTWLTTVEILFFSFHLEIIISLQKLDPLKQSW